MSARLETAFAETGCALDPRGLDWPDHYIVSHGNSGALASFAVKERMLLSRGDRVVLDTPRGLEWGDVLGPASVRQSRLLGLGDGVILREFTIADEVTLAAARLRAREVFEAARCQARTCPLEILDVEILLDGRRAFVQFLSPAADGIEEFAVRLGTSCGLEVLMENLALPVAEDADSGCGKPNCGRAEGGSCSSCGAGGCSSCGDPKVDLRAYFGHLRGQMEASQRTPLL